jgi:hypothetical protein
MTAGATVTIMLAVYDLGLFKDPLTVAPLTQWPIDWQG